MVEVLYRRNRVEDTFNDLKKKTTLSAKYPHIDLFNNKSSSSSSSKLDLMNLDQLNKATKVENNDVASMDGHSAFDFDKRIEDIDEWTDCSSLVPEFIKTERADNPELYTTTPTKNNSKKQKKMVLKNELTDETHNNDDEKKLFKNDKEKRISNSLNENVGIAGSPINYLESKYEINK
jgi:hypothetical protein